MGIRKERIQGTVGGNRSCVGGGSTTSSVTGREETGRDGSQFVDMAVVI